MSKGKNGNAFQGKHSIKKLMVNNRRAMVKGRNMKSEKESH